MLRAVAGGLCVLGLAGAMATGAIASINQGGSPFVVDFTDYRSGSIDQWLKSKGFEFQRDAKSPDKIALKADARGLEVQALKPAQGLLINRQIYPNAYSAVEIEWGVDQHPEGASYEQRVNNEAIMVHVFFGTDKKSSGSMFAPDLPAFIGLFLCNGDRVDHPYVGRYYQEGGRYVCVDNAQPQQRLVSRYDLKQGFRKAFGTELADAVTGYSIEVDTSASRGGQSSAYIKRIKFLP
jgi:hypothetical protein